MKRLLGGILVMALVAIAAWGACSYWFGIQAEREYKAMIERSADWRSFRLTGGEYTRGVFRSEAKATLELTNTPPLPSLSDTQEDQPFPFKLMLTHKISHGPIPFGMLPHAGGIMRPALAVIETQTNLDPQAKERLKDVRLLENMPSLDVITVLKWGGDGDTHLTIPPYKGELGEESKASVDFSGFKSHVEFTPGFKRFKGSFSTDGFRAAIPDEGDFSLLSMSCSFDQSQGISGFYLGDVHYSLALISFKHGDPAKVQKDFSIKGFSIKTQAQETGNDLSSSVTLALDQVNNEKGSFNDAIFEIEFRKLDGGVLGEFQKTLKQAQHQSASSDQLSEMTLGAFLGLLPKLLKNSPEVEIKQLGFASPEGEIKASAKLAVDGRNIQGPLSLPMLLQSSRLDASLSAAEKPLVRLLRSLESSDQTTTDGAEAEESNPSPNNDEDLELELRKTLSVLVARRFLVLENGIYRANASYAGGQLNLNGQPIRLDRLLGGQ
jgi:uncharacterized protein YdgA (DUF945 family)